jgi:hypothetical protein
MNVYLRDERWRLRDVGFETSRTDYHGPAPYRYDNDYPHAMSLVPEPLFTEGPERFE